MNKPLTDQGRDSEGRYTYENRWERLCTCGHTLGNHTAVAPHTCIEGDFSAVSCSCAKFRPSRKVKP